MSSATSRWTRTGQAAVPGEVESLQVPVDGADDQHRVREVGHGSGGRQAGIDAGGRDRLRNSAPKTRGFWHLLTS